MVTTLEKKQAAAAKARAAKERNKRKRKPKLGADSIQRAKAPIRDDETYSLSLIYELFGISRVTLTQMYREGLKYSKVGNQKFISGKELRRCIDERAAAAEIS